MMVVVATASVIVAWFVAMYLLAFFGFPQSWIVMIAPISSIIVAGIFLYLGRNKLRGSAASSASVLELDNPVLPAKGNAAQQASITEFTEDVAPARSTAPDDMLPSARTEVLEVPKTAEESSEIPTAVRKVMDEIEKRSDVRCIIIAAPSHGVLQDRLNNWLSGGYGRVVSASMAMNGKGFYLTVFYEPVAE
jgi:hypothetical protein